MVNEDVIRVVVFPEGRVYVAQAIDINLATQGATLLEVLEELSGMFSDRDGWVNVAVPPPAPVMYVPYYDAGFDVGEVSLGRRRGRVHWLPVRPQGIGLVVYPAGTPVRCCLQVTERGDDIPELVADGYGANRDEALATALATADRRLITVRLAAAKRRLRPEELSAELIESWGKVFCTLPPTTLRAMLQDLGPLSDVSAMLDALAINGQVVAGTVEPPPPGVSRMSLMLEDGILEVVLADRRLTLTHLDQRLGAGTPLAGRITRYSITVPSAPFRCAIYATADCQGAITKLELRRE